MKLFYSFDNCRLNTNEDELFDTIKCIEDDCTFDKRDK